MDITGILLCLCITNFINQIITSHPENIRFYQTNNPRSVSSEDYPILDFLTLLVRGSLTGAENVKIFKKSPVFRDSRQIPFFWNGQLR